MARTDTLNNYLTDVAQAIKTKKGDNTPIKASDFDKEIENLPTGGDSFIPNPTWWDIEKIIKEDTEDYPAKIIFLMTDDNDKNYFSFTDTIEKIKTSDDYTYLKEDGNKSHTWDRTQDKQSNEGYKTRYVIYYFNDINTGYFNNNFHPTTLYLVMDKAQSPFCNVETQGVFYEYKMLEDYKTLNGAKVLAFGSGPSNFNNCYHLKRIHDVVFVGEINRLFAFQNTYGVRSIELDLSNVSVSQLKIFDYCLAMSWCDFTLIPVSLTLNSPYLTPDCLRLLIDQLVDNTGNETVYTLTIGTTNLKKLTDEDIQKATDKNWEIK